MAAKLEFRLLGPLEVLDGGTPLRLGGVKQRSVLAILLLRAGEVVSADTLVDALWGDAPPEDAATALQQHVSRLRRALEPHEVVRTRAPGYVVEPSAGERDLDRFATLVEAGRRRLAAGEAQAAAATLREALGLWRGRPLGDLELEAFAAEAVRRLDEAWIEALELRVEADLELGRHGELIGELRALVRRHPLRERLRGQLMLALYRAGRQGEALEVFAEGRRELAEELGLEPGPALRRLHQSILEHDPALEAERSPDPPRAGPRRRRTAARTAPALVMGAAAAAAAAILLAGAGEERGPASANRAAPGRIVALDATTGAVRWRVPAGRTPAAVAGVAGGRVWIVDADARTLLAVDPESGEVEALATGGTPADVSVAGGAVWVGNGRPLASAQYVGPVPTQVVRFDSHARTPRATIRLPTGGGAVSNAVENRLAATSDAVWAVTPSGGVVRIDAATSEVTASRPRLGAIAVAAGGSGVWALRPDGGVLRLDPRTARVARRIRLPTAAPTAIAAGDSAAFVTSSVDASLWRVGGDGEVGAVEVGSGAADLASDGGAVWIANPLAGTLTRVDARSMRVSARVSVGGIPRAVTVDAGTVYAAVGRESAPVSTSAAGLRVLPRETCGPLMAGHGKADVLIVSDLPLQGGIRITATQMAQAITFVLREHGFRAGRFRIGFQSCDDSVARTGLFDEAKCAANARAYGRNPDVVAVIGPLNSPCAVAAVPELNRAPGGPLAMVGPLTSFVGLTRQGPGVPPTLLAELYPTGRRNFLRVYPTDDLQGAALAQMARDLHRGVVYVLDDGDPGYGRLMATGFATAARRLGLRVAGRASWNPQASSYRRLARRVAASGARAVFVGGLLDTNAAQLVRDLRAELPRDTVLMGPDGLTPLSLLVRGAGPAARGMLVSLAGVVTEALPPEGREFVERFAATQPGATIEPSAVYAAQATEVVLDALARSDGTRGGVLDALFDTRISGGLLGDFGFDERGDTTESPVTILRVAGGRGSTRIQSAEGGVIERVTRGATDLVAPAP